MYILKSLQITLGVVVVVEFTTTEVVSSNPAQARRTRYNITW
jgi:hypothetical protein